MNFITLTPENLETEHICCAMSNKSDPQVVSKKNWLKERLAEGLVFRRADVRGKCFIEYIPAEYAWQPIDAPGYMFINCFWISGQLKGHGYSNDLLNGAIEDSKAKGKVGLAILSSKKKLGFLADPKYLRYKGFQLADSADPYFELMYLPFDSEAEIPKFKAQVKEKNNMGEGFTLYYTSQCPFNGKYVPILEGIAQERGVKLNAIHVETGEQARNAPTPYTTFALFYQNKFITHETLSEGKFIKILDSI